MPAREGFGALGGSARRSLGRPKRGTLFKDKKPWKMLDKMERCGDFDGISPGKWGFIDRKMVVYRIYSPFYLEKIWGLLIKNGTESNRFFR